MIKLRKLCALSALFFLIFPGTLHAVDTPFLTSISLTETAAPAAVATGDVDGDGRMDVISVIPGATAHISVRLQNSDHSFGAPITTSISSNPSAIVVGDFNGDHILDAAVADSATNTVAIYTGVGDGTFHGIGTYTTGSMPVFLLLQDVTGDGKLELLVACSNSSSLNLFAINADGTLAAKASIPTALSQPVAIAAADFDNNGKVDLAVIGHVNDYSLLRGNGDGTFQLPIHNILFNTANPESIVAGDLNGDGKMDLVIGTGDTAVLIGNGDMTFSPHIYKPVGASDTVALADLNKDGKLDIVSASRLDCIVVQLNQGNGTFGAGKQYASGLWPGALAIADFNGDGVSDVLVGNFGPYGNDHLDVIYGLGNGTLSDGFVTIQSSNGSVGTTAGLAMADLDGDGLPDAISADAAPRVNILRNIGGYRFSLNSTITLAEGPQNVEVGDIDGDGHPDIAVVGYSNFYIIPGTGPLSFGTPITVQLPPAVAAPGGPAPNVTHRIAIADLNNDGLMDVIVTNVGATFSDIAVYMNTGNFTFGPANVISVGEGPAELVVADFNHDLIPDIAVATYPGFTLLLGKGDGTFNTGRQFASSGSNLSIPQMAAGDVNGDGNLDVIVTSSAYNSSSGTNTSSISAFFGDGQGAFSAPSSKPLTDMQGEITTGDFNGDGHIDIAAASGSQIELFFSDGSEQLSSPVTIPGSHMITRLLAVPVEDTGIPDLIFASDNDLLMAVANLHGTKIVSTSSLNPSTYGQSVQFNVTAAAPLPHLPAPTGTITFADGTQELATSSLPSATFSTNSLTAGTHSIGLQYSGDASFYARPASAITQVINKASVSLSASANSPALLSAPLSVTVAAAPQYAGTPTGTVTLSEGATQLASAALDAQAQASLSTATLPAGPHTLTVSYAGDSNFKTSTTQVSADVVNPTTLVLGSSSPSVTFGTALTLQAVLTSPGGVPSGSITFLDGATSIGTATLDSHGKASLSISNLFGGLHNLVSRFDGNSYYAAATSSAVVQQITPSVPTISMQTSVTTIGAGYPVTFTANLSPNAGVYPTGVVTFASGQLSFGSAILNNNGVATVSTPMNVPSGTVNITANYAGDTNFTSAQSSNVALSVTPDFVVTTPTQSTMTVVAGQSGTLNLSLNSFSGFSGTLSFSCSNLPALATCTFNPASVTLGTNAPSTVTVTVATVGRTSAMLHSAPLSNLYQVFAILSFGLVGIVIARRSPRKAVNITMLGMVLSMVIGMAACGGGGSSGGSTQTVHPSTPAGTTQVAVVVSGTQNGATVSHQINFTLTVQ